MAPRQPLTGRVVEHLLEAQQRLRVIARQGGVDAAAAAALERAAAEIGDALACAEQADEARREVIFILNHGEVSPWRLRLARHWAAQEDGHEAA